LAFRKFIRAFPFSSDNVRGASQVDWPRARVGN